MITVRDFCEMSGDDSAPIAIWDAKTENEVFRGEMRDAIFGDYADNYVEGFDPPYGDDAVICLNIDTSDD